MGYNVIIGETMNVIVKNQKITRKLKKWGFYTAIIIGPVIQVFLLYFCVNFQSFFMAFQKYDAVTGIWSWNGFENFKNVFYDLKTLPLFGYAIKNSILAWFWTSLVTIFLGLIFANYIARKGRGWSFFRVMLFLPSILSAAVLTIMFKYFADYAVPKVINDIFGTNLFGLLSAKETKLPTIISFTIFISFGTQVLVFTSSISAIPESIFEAGELDGVTPMKEFFFLVLPQIIPTISVFVIAGLANMFNNQLNLYAFYFDMADIPIQTMGYYLYRTIQMAKTQTEYPYISAVGTLCTVIITPIVLFCKWGSKKIDPMED